MHKKQKRRESPPAVKGSWLRGRDLNPGPLGYEPNELPDCSTPRQEGARYLSAAERSSRRATKRGSPHPFPPAARCARRDLRSRAALIEARRLEFSRLRSAITLSSCRISARAFFNSSTRPS